MDSVSPLFPYRDVWEMRGGCVVVVEVRGGCVINVACSRPGDVLVVDWDNLKESPENTPGYSEMCCIVDLDEDTQKVVDDSGLLFT